MGGHYVGKFVLKVYLSNGRVGYAMEIEDGALMITDDPESAARFLTKGGANSFYEKIMYLPNFLDRDAFITEAYIYKMDNL